MENQRIRSADLPELECIIRPRMDFKNLPGIKQDYVTLLVANFPHGTEKEELFELFEDYEPVDVFMMVNSEDQNYDYTFAYLVLPNEKLAETAVFELDATSFKKNELVVCYAMEKLA